MSELNGKTYNEVPDGFYDCVIVSAKRCDSEKAMKHFIVSLGVRKADDVDAAAYWVNLPLCFDPGQPWWFFDKERKINAERPAKVEDTTEAWEFARKCFPDWAAFCDNLDDASGIKDAIAWFGSDASKDVICHCKLTNKDGTNAKGEPVRKHYASVFEPKNRVIATTNDDNARFEKSLDAAGIQIGRKVARAAKANGAPAPAAKMSAPPPAAAKKYTAEDSWAAYEQNRKATDPKGAEYWSQVEHIVGKDPGEYKSFTSDDWKKCVDAFSLPF